MIFLKIFTWTYITLSSGFEISGTVVPCNTTKVLVFECNDGITCVDRWKSYCNGVSDCPDGSDEFEYDPNEEARLGISCRNYQLQQEKRCHLPHRYMCDHETDCIGGLDECDCGHTFKCLDGSCAVKASFCDSEEHCPDGSDEILYNRSMPIGFQCPVTQQHESRNCVLPDHHVCDGVSNCDNGVDECFCGFNAQGRGGQYITNSFSNSKCFRCLDGSLIIPQKQLCDGTIHCADLSDECLCTAKKGYTRLTICDSVCDGVDCECPGQIMCNLPETSSDTKVCLPSSYICDYKIDCSDASDERYCADSDEFFTCFDNRTRIRLSEFCDGESNCADGSDEKFCPELSNHYCHYYRRFFPYVADWEDPSLIVRIPYGLKLQRYYPMYAQKCDGIPTCPRATDECMASGCEDNRPGYCQFIEPGQAFKCNNSGSLLLGVEICDGDPTCNETHPQLSMDELFCPDRYYCKDKGASSLPIHIPLRSRCDGIQDCHDISDEVHCSRHTHFYCEDGGSKVFIKNSEVCDGTNDCRSGIDECQNCNPSPFSSDTNLIKFLFLKSALWMIGLFAIGGNVFAIWKTITSLNNQTKKESAVWKYNKILVFNLAVADVLVAIYLVWLAIMDISTSNYCVVDQEWRASSVCAGLGTMAVIGTEVSVFTLLTMTGYRVFVVRNPYKKYGHEMVYVAIFGSWILAIAIAVIPSIGALSDYFISCVWYSQNEFFGLICKKEAIDFVRELAKRSSGTGKFNAVANGDFSWSNILAAISDLNSTYVPERYFGYYSAHSVCLPRIFPDLEQDISWGYSLFLVLVNFTAFLAILISYRYVYWKTMSRRGATASNDQAEIMQRKITKIVLTDFFCWIPICILAFMKLLGFQISLEAYAFSAIILLPINSAINPFLYSDIAETLSKIRGKIDKLQAVSSNERVTEIGTVCMSTSVEGTKAAASQITGSRS